MNQAVPIYIVAFSGEAPALCATLERCAPLREPSVTVLCSEDPALVECAGQAGRPVLRALPPTSDPSQYWSVVTRALPPTAGVCLIVRAGTDLPDYWDRRLQAPSPDVAALFPLSVRHPCTSVFSGTDHEPGLKVCDIDRWLNAYLSGLTFDIPTFAGETALINPEKFPRQGALDETALAEAVRQGGGLILATDNLYVDDRQLDPRSLPGALYEAWEQAINQRHPLTAVRHALTELSGRGEAPPPQIPPVRPAILHVSHSWGGGLGGWIEDFVTADDTYLNYVLRPIGDLSGFGQTLALYSAADLASPIETWTLAQPILSTAIAHYEYAGLLADVVGQYHIEAILVSSLIGQSLDALRSDVPTVVVVHDFYPFCPPIQAFWESPCLHCDNKRLSACLRENPGHQFFRHEGEGHFRALRQAYLDEVVQRRLPMVVPSQSVADRLYSLAPLLHSRPMQVIPHGLPADLLAGMAPVNAGVTGDRRLHIVVLGSLGSHKGAELLLAAMERLSAIADFVFLGCGDSAATLADIPNAQVVERYQRGELGKLLAEQQPDLGLLLSVVPETFSYTLSELRAAAIPVVATALGAFSDRISHGEDGWLIEPDSAALIAQVEALAARPEQIAEVRARLTKMSQRDTAQMVADYHALLPSVSGAVKRPLRYGAQLLSDKRHLRINPEASYRQVLREFWEYTVAKVENTDRLPAYVKRMLLAVIRRF